MASNKFIALVFLFVSLMVAPISQGGLLSGILGGLGGLGGGGGSSGLGGLVGGIGSGGLGGLLGLISGNVSCSLDGSTSVVNGVATTPAFSNAQVQLKCGGKVISSTTTDANGGFAITLNFGQNLVLLLEGCNIIVNTPLSTCDANLPSVGYLLSPLKNIGTILSNVINIIPAGFLFIN